MRRALLGGLATLCVLSLFAPGVSAADTAEDPAELERTWLAARVALPGEHVNEAKRYSSRMDNALSEGAFEKIPRDVRYPLIVFMHGCVGIGEATREIAKLSALEEFAVIAPDSFARRYKPKTCNPETHSGGLHREAVFFRIAEAGHAIRRARTLSWVDPRNVFLAGESEGGITAAMFTGEPLTARVIEGWHCQAPPRWRHIRGLAAPESEPVLALWAANDPWHRRDKIASWFRGDCGVFMSKTNGSVSVVFKDRLKDRHSLLTNHAVQQTFFEFLRRHSVNG